MKASIFIIIISLVSFAGFAQDDTIHNKVSKQYLDDGLIAYYPFNGNAADESGNGNDGTVYGATLTKDRFNNDNSAYKFDGNNDYIVINHSDMLNFNHEISISFWVKFETNAPYYFPYHIIEKYDAWGLGQREHDVNWGVTTENGYANVWAKNFDFNKFYHFVMTYDGSLIKTFANGRLVASAKASGLLNTNNNNVYIGRYNFGGDYFFDGTLDDFRIYDRALSDAEIVNLFHENNWENNDTALEISILSDLKGKFQTYGNSLIYFYCNVDNAGDIDYLLNSASIHFSTNKGQIPASLKYLGNGILQIELNIRSLHNVNALTFELPDIVQDEKGKTIKFLAKPAPVNIEFIEPEIQQSDDFFAGGSLGAKLVAGGVGLGPSISAAAVSVEGTAGMGMTISRKNDQDQFLSRRLELGIGLKAKAPEVNPMAGEMDIGAKAGLGMEGVIKQNIRFPSEMDHDLLLKAKAYSILETFSLGGIELSPLSSLFINALRKSLLNYNPDLQQVYRQLYYSTECGVGAYLEKGIEVSFTLSQNICEFSLAQLKNSIHFGLGIEQNHQNNHSLFKMSLAGGYNAGLLQFEFLDGFELNPLLESSDGTKMTLEADFIKNYGFDDFRINFDFSQKNSISLIDYSVWNQLKYKIPREIIQKNLNANNLIGFVSPFVYSSFRNKKIYLSTEEIVNDLIHFIQNTPVTLDDFNKYTTVSRYQSIAFGTSYALKLDLTGEVGIGGGLKLGMEYSFLDELKYPLSSYVIADKLLLPLYKFDPLSPDDRLYNLNDEMVDLFKGTSMLIKDALLELQEKTELAIDAGKQFVNSFFNNSAVVAGKISQKGKLIVRRISSAIKRTKKSAFNGSEVINVYTSNRVVSLEEQKKGTHSDNNSTLYIISDHYNISFIDESDSVVTDFDPVSLSIAMNSDILGELDLQDYDLQNAKMYYYDCDSLIWIELPDNSYPSPDMVTSKVSKSGTYAVGIAYDDSMDKTPVAIVDFFPRNLSAIQPYDTLWADLYEGPVSSGIDFTRTRIMIDGDEVEAEWNPVNNRLMYIPKQPISEGDHSFNVVAYDHNDNYSNVYSVFHVQSTGIFYQPLIENAFRIESYPNPAKENLIISVFSVKPTDRAQISLYNAKGELISILYEGVIQEGRNEFEIQRHGSLFPALKPGIYFIKYSDASRTLVKKLIFN